jgi:hypothetical protein
VNDRYKLQKTKIIDFGDRISGDLSNPDGVDQVISTKIYSRKVWI